MPLNICSNCKKPRRILLNFILLTGDPDTPILYFLVLIHPITREYDKIQLLKHLGFPVTVELLWRTEKFHSLI